MPWGSNEGSEWVVVVAKGLNGTQWGAVVEVIDWPCCVVARGVVSWSCRVALH